MKFAMPAAVKWSLGGVLLLALAWWIDRTIGWRALLAPWRELSWQHLSVLVGLVALSYLTRAARLFDLYRVRLPAPFMLYLRINVLHTTVLNLMPMRSGETAFPLLMKHHLGERYRDSLANLLWLRVADLWILLWVGLVAFALDGRPLLWLPVLLAALMPLTMHPLRRRIMRAGASNRLVKFAGFLVGGLPDRFVVYLRLLGWTLATWSLKLAAFVSVAAHFAEAPAIALVPGVIAAEISSALPVHGIAGFGSYELAMVLGSSASSLDVDTLLMAAVNLHLFVLACTLVFGAVALLIPTRHRTAEKRDGD